MSALNTNLIPQVLRFVEVSSALSKRALDELGVRQTAEKRAAALTPALVSHMLQTGVIGENQKQAAAEMLASHEQTLALLKNAVDQIATLKAKTTKTAGALGQGVDGGAAGAEGTPTDPNWSLESPFVGQRSGEKKASDVAMLKGLGLA